MAEDEARILSAVSSLNRAWLDRRYDDIGPLVHESVVIAPLGTQAVKGRAAFVKGFVDFGNAATIHSFERRDVRVDIWGETAVAQCPFVIDYEIPSGRFKEEGVDVLVFTKVNDAWLICWRTMSSAPVSEPA